VFLEYTEVCHLQREKPVTNSLFGKLVKAVFPSIRTCRKGPRTDSRTHYAGLHRRKETISLPVVCPETGELVMPSSPPPVSGSTSPPSASSSSNCLESAPTMISMVSLSSRAAACACKRPSSAGHLCRNAATALSGASSSAAAAAAAAACCPPATLQPMQLFSVCQQKQQQQLQHTCHDGKHMGCCTAPPSLSSCSSGSSTTYDDALSEFDDMELSDLPLAFCEDGGDSFSNGTEGFDDPTSFSSSLTFPPVAASAHGEPVPSSFSCDDIRHQHQHHFHHLHQEGSQSGLLQATVEDEEDERDKEQLMGLTALPLRSLDPASLHRLSVGPLQDDLTSAENMFCTTFETQVPAVQMSSAMMANPASPPPSASPPASPPPQLALLSESSEFCQPTVMAGDGALVTSHPQQDHHHHRIRPFLRRTAMAAAEGNPFAESLIGMISTCHKIISQKRRRKGTEPHQMSPLSHPTMAHLPVSLIAGVVPPFVLSLETIPGGQNNFSVQESMLVFAEEYRKTNQGVLERLVRFEYAILVDVLFSFWNQVKLHSSLCALLGHDSVKNQILTYDKKVLQSFKNFFSTNPLKMSAQQFGGFLQTIAFHLSFSIEQATQSLLPSDLYEEKMRLVLAFAADLRNQAQNSSPHQVPTMMEINNY